MEDLLETIAYKILREAKMIESGSLSQPGTLAVEKCGEIISYK